MTECKHRWKLEKQMHPSPAVCVKCGAVTVFRGGVAGDGNWQGIQADIKEIAER